MINLKRLHPLELEWEAIEKNCRLSPYNAPLNRETEQKKLFAAYANNETYNPQFVYRTAPTYPLEHIREFINRLAPESSPLEMIYADKAALKLLTIHSIQTHAPEIITEMTRSAYGFPEQQLLANAQAILTQPHSTSSAVEDVPDEQAATWLQSALIKMGIQEWRAVVYEPMNATMSVNRLDKEVHIRKGTMFSQKSLRRLLVHELGVHVLRYENGVTQPIRLFRNGFTRYLDTEEGLAVYSEDKADLLEIETLRKYAGRVLAADLALEKSFFAVFETLTPLLGQEMSFEITTRAKRGFTDTAQPGAHTKDIVYLQGFLRVKEHLQQQPEDYLLLFTGKIGLQHLSLVKKLIENGFATLPKKLPENIIT